LSNFQQFCPSLVFDERASLQHIRTCFSFYYSTLISLLVLSVTSMMNSQPVSTMLFRISANEVRQANFFVVFFF
jgi:hypothetical protein